MFSPYSLVSALLLSAAFTTSLHAEAAGRQARKTVLIPVGVVDEAALQNLACPLEARFGLGVEIGNPIARPEGAYNPKRGQYLADPILDKLKKFKAPGVARLLGVADFDLYAPGLNFIFGQADPAGGVAIFSLVRLRGEFYGMPGDKPLFQKRALKEAVHELGHTFGLDHYIMFTCTLSNISRSKSKDPLGSKSAPK